MCKYGNSNELSNLPEDCSQQTCESHPGAKPFSLPQAGKCKLRCPLNNSRKCVQFESINVAWKTNGLFTRTR